MGKTENEGRTLTFYVTDQEWKLLRYAVRQQGEEGTDRQVSLFAKQWAKAGVRMPIREALEKFLFKQ